MKREYLIETLTDGLLIWLPGDILYLYFAGGWQEPNQFILYAELVALPLIVLFGVWRLGRFIVNGRKGTQNDR